MDLSVPIVRASAAMFQAGEGCATSRGGLTVQLACYAGGTPYGATILGDDPSSRVTVGAEDLRALASILMGALTVNEMTAAERDEAGL